MKICLLLPSFLPTVGGLEKAADRLARELIRRGHEVVILTRVLDPPHSAVECPFPIRYYAKPISATWWPHSIESAMETTHREFGVEIVCAYHPYPPGFCALRFGRRHGIATVISCRGGDISEGSRYLKRWISRRRTIWTLRNAAAVHVLSEELRERVSVLTKGETGSHVIHNAVDAADSGPPQAVPREARLLENRSFILTLGRLHRFKGVRVLLDAMAILRNENVEMPLLAIAGNGPEKDALVSQVREMGLINHVRFLGDMRGQDKAWLLANCLFFVHPSLGEGMPNSVLEAMSYGKPVVGTRIGGMTDLIHNGRGGILTEPGDAGALAGAIRQMLESNHTGYCRDAEDIAWNHSWDRITQQYLDLLESVMRFRPAAERSGDPVCGNRQV